MSSVSVRLSAQQQFAYVPHTSVSGETWSLTTTSTTTSAGASDGTTIVDTSIQTTGIADTYNGRWWVEIRSGACRGQWKRVVDDNGTTTLTLENNGFSAQIASGVNYAIWRSPEPVVVVDSSSGETNMVDAYRTENNDFWNGYYAIPITGTHRGKMAQVTDFTKTGGVFVLASSFGSALAAGDVVLLRKFVEVSKTQPQLVEGYSPRASNRINFSIPDGVVGARGGSVSFDTDVLASGTLAAAGSVANKSVLSGLFQAVGYDETSSTSSACDGGSPSLTGADIYVTTATWENFAIGSAIMHRGEARCVTAAADGGGSADTLYVTPSFYGMPATTVAVNASTMYKRSVTGDTYGVCIELESDGVRTTMTGCKGNLTLALGDSKAAFNWSLNVDHWVREIEAAPYNANTAYTSATPIMSHARGFYISASPTNIGGSISASLNTETQPIPVQSSVGINGRAGYHIVNTAPTMTFREILSAASAGTLAAEIRWGARTSQDVILVLGAHANCVVIRMPVARLIQVPNPDDDNGALGTPELLQAQDAGTYTDPGSTVVKVPDFSISIF